MAELTVEDQCLYEVQTRARMSLTSGSATPYANYSNEIMAHSAAGLLELSFELTPEFSEWLDAERAKDALNPALRTAARRSSILALFRIAALAVSLLAVAAGVYYLIPNVPKFDLSLAVILITMTLAASTVLTLTLWRTNTMRRARLIRSPAEEREAIAKAEFNRLADARVEVVLNEAASQLFKELEELPLVPPAPSLVETSDAPIVHSRTLLTVSEFMNQHHTAAIGLCGPRGAGKTSLMTELCRLASPSTLCVRIEAPVNYESSDFITHVFAEVIRAALQHRRPAQPGRSKPPGRRPGRPGLRTPPLHPDRSTPPVRPRLGDVYANLIVAIAKQWTVVAGIGLIVLGGWISLYASSYYIDLSSWRDNTRLGANALMGTGMALLFGSLLVLTAKQRVGQIGRRNDSRNAPERALARTLHGLDWTLQIQKGSEAEVSEFGGLLKSNFTTSKTEVERPTSRPRLTTNFRDALSRYLFESKWSRILICVDELDKIGNPADALNLINELKDLMHVPGIYFVVSVSTDALVDFSLRGFSVRTAIDSTFDEVFYVNELTLLEAEKVLQGHAPLFPTPLIRFCYARSGGLPRDLLRSARACVAVMDRSSSRPSLAAVTRAVVLDDAVRAFEALVTKADAYRKLSQEGQERLLQANRADAYDTLALLRAIANEFLVGDDPLAWQDFLQFLDLSDSILEVFDRELSYSDWLDITDGELDADCENLARRMRLLGERTLSTRLIA